MNCDCVKDLEKRMVGAGYKEAKVLNQAFILGDSISVSLNIPVEYREDKKDGTPKKNKSSINVICSFCPLCGKPTKKEEVKDV